MRHAVLAVLLSVAARAAEAPRELWSFSPDKAVLSCAPEGGAAKVVVKGLTWRDTTALPPLKVSLRAEISADAAAAAVFRLAGGTTTVKFYRGCAPAWTGKVEGHEVYYEMFTSSGHGVLVSPSHGVMATFIEPPPYDNDDETPRRGKMILLKGARRVIAMLDFIPGIILGNARFDLTSNGRYAKSHFLGGYHFFDLEAGRYHLYAPKPTDFIREASITDEGRVVIMRVQKVVFPNGLEVPGGEFKRPRINMQIEREIGAELYNQQRYILEVAHEFQF